MNSMDRLPEHFLRIDPSAEVEKITSSLRDAVHGTLRRYGAVVGISGGVDSSVVLALCVRAFGAERCLGLILPEKESDPESEILARKTAQRFGVKVLVEDISAALAGLDCYERRDTSIRELIPEYESALGYKAKIILPGSLLDSDVLNVFYLSVSNPQGEETRHRLPPKVLRSIIAATNFKQRTRMLMLYHHAEVQNFAVVGTANRNEHALGFFVKHGDGGADVMPIQHLLKTQVFQLAEHLSIPEEICQRVPATDTYSAGGTQEEFFYRVPFKFLDTVWAAREEGYSVEAIAQYLDLTEQQVERIWQDLERKRTTTAYLRMAPIRCEDAA